MRITIYVRTYERVKEIAKEVFETFENTDKILTDFYTVDRLTGGSYIVLKNDLTIFVKVLKTSVRCHLSDIILVDKDINLTEQENNYLKRIIGRTNGEFFGNKLGTYNSQLLENIVKQYYFSYDSCFKFIKSYELAELKYCQDRIKKILESEEQ